jgi:tRNA nucleotidyltransferase (CCA-adding enzyme)
MCRTLKGEFETLPKERVWEEWKKWALKANKPSLGLRFLVDCDWVSHFPELEHLIGVPQDPEWHPEGQDDPLGSAFIHTLHVTDAAAVIADRENLQDEDRVTIILAALCHDLGKAFPKHGGTTEFLDGRWRANAHAEAGVPLSRDFLKRIGCLDRIIDRILPLVAEHMVCTNSLKDIGPRMVRRLCSRLGAATLRELMMIFEADHSGRPPIPAGLGDGAKKIWEIAETLSLKEKKPVGIIGGKHLLAKGLKPGSQFGLIIKQCFEAQLDGVFADEAGAVAHLEEILKCH